MRQCVQSPRVITVVRQPHAKVLSSMRSDHPNCSMIKEFFAHTDVLSGRVLLEATCMTIPYGCCASVTPSHAFCLFVSSADTVSPRRKNGAAHGSVPYDHCIKLRETCNTPSALLGKSKSHGRRIPEIQQGGCATYTSLQGLRSTLIWVMLLVRVVERS